MDKKTYKGAKITVSEVREAFKTIGKSPMKRKWISAGGLKCCPLSALAKATHPSFTQAEQCEVWARGKYGNKYVDGFTQAIDQWAINNKWVGRYASPQSKQGLRDGHRVGVALGLV